MNQEQFRLDCLRHTNVPRAQCFPWTPKFDGPPGDPPGVTRWEDQRIYGVHDFKRGFVMRYDAPDMSLITKKSNLEFILQQYSSQLTAGDLCAILKKSRFFSREGFITSEGLQKIAMNSRSHIAFRFCPIAQNNPAIVSKMLKKTINYVYDLTDHALRRASAQIAADQPLSLPWYTNIAISSMLRFRNAADACLDISQISATGVAVMVRYWLRHPEQVYDFIEGTSPPRATPEQMVGVSDRIVRKGLRHLRVVIRDPAQSRELTSKERDEIRREVGELLGSRDLLGAEIRSWCNKLAVLSMSSGDARQGMPLVDGCDKASTIVYTKEMARACFERGNAYSNIVCETPRRGDRVLRMLHDARREDLCVTVIPRIAEYVLTPAPTRFAPRWPKFDHRGS